MDLIIVFIIFSIIINIVGSNKKSKKMQKKVTISPVYKKIMEAKNVIDEGWPKNLTVDHSNTQVTNKNIQDIQPKRKAKQISIVDLKETAKEIEISKENTELPFNNLPDMQRAIVMSEVLSKPKALRR